ncbi:Uncharacterised protein [Mycobacteroides abscessus subsp. abscessus]|nr:Uncharacterised protein [Mycobacteroides abscessus subsp. abscessus]
MAVGMQVSTAISRIWGGLALIVRFASSMRLQRTAHVRRKT